MEKYGTPQKKTEEDGKVKVAATETKACCRKLLEVLEPGKSIICECGNQLTAERA